MSKKISTFFLILPILMFTISCGVKKPMDKTVIYQENKIIPKSLFKEVKTALSFYPELKDVPIHFQYKDDINKSLMQAQPDFGNLFKGKEKRTYNVYVSSRFFIEDEEFSLTDVPSDVLVGWLGHELGHIMDYRDRSAAGLMIFGLNYVTSSGFIEKAEGAADTYAVNHGMGEYVLATKNFILNHSDLPDSYKEKIKRLYLSPEEIVVLVNQINEDQQDTFQE